MSTFDNILKKIENGNLMPVYFFVENGILNITWIVNWRLADGKIFFETLEVSENEFAVFKEAAKKNWGTHLGELIGGEYDPFIADTEAEAEDD